MAFPLGVADLRGARLGRPRPGGREDRRTKRLRLRVFSGAEPSGTFHGRGGATGRASAARRSAPCHLREGSMAVPDRFGRGSSSSSVPAAAGIERGPGDQRSRARSSCRDTPPCPPRDRSAPAGRRRRTGRAVRWRGSVPDAPWPDAPERRPAHPEGTGDLTRSACRRPAGLRSRAPAGAPRPGISDPLHPPGTAQVGAGPGERPRHVGRRVVRGGRGVDRRRRGPHPFRAARAGCSGDLRQGWQAGRCG